MSNRYMYHRNGVKFLRKDHSALMKCCNFFYNILGRDFMTDSWTTFNDTVYYPSNLDDPFLPYYKLDIEHEIYHIRQFKRYGIVLFMIFYYIVPLPVIFSGRWFLERNAYLSELLYIKEKSPLLLTDMYLEDFCNSLVCFYFYMWPKRLMLKWFKKKLQLK